MVYSFLPSKGRVYLRATQVVVGVLANPLPGRLPATPYTGICDDRGVCLGNVWWWLIPVANRCQAATFLRYKGEAMRFRVTRVATAVLVCLSAIVAISGISNPQSLAPTTQAAQKNPNKPTVVYQNLALPTGESAVVFSNGVAEVFSKDHRRVEFRQVPLSLSLDGTSGTGVLPDKANVIAELAKAAPSQYVPNELIVVFSSGIAPARDVLTVPASTIVAMRKAETPAARAAVAPAYTNSAGTNATLAGLGVDRMERLFRQFNRTTLKSRRDHAQSAVAFPLLDISSAYRLHITGASVSQALVTLLQSSDIAYVSPNWTVSTMNAPALSLAQASRDVTAASHTQPRFGANATSGAGVPGNGALASSAQSLLNAPGVNAVPAFDEIASAYGELPGQGETITNVSLGDLTDASAAANPGDACYNYTSALGPTTEIINGQRYINWPTMPLIPTYTADASGNLDGKGEVCGVDPFLYEVGLDFSMMAPLPHNQQRPGFTGSGTYDLLGIAPGASYRLVVPASNSPTISEVDAAFLAAANQSPKPDVITASLGFGIDQYGLPSRYLEDDALTRSVVATLVHADNIVVCISGGDGLRLVTNAAIGPSGGSAATNVIGKNGTPTDLNDIFLSTMPSLDPDTGAIAVGGSTLDDIFAAPPQDPANAALSAQHAFPQTRWTGAMNFSSGFGSRMNVSAPSDNVLSFAHAFSSDPTVVTQVIEGGTSASAPMTAAAAAIALQVVRLTHNASVRSATDVRALLANTGRPLPQTPQTDVDINVGPQIDIGNMVETLLRADGKHVASAVARVAVERRRVFYGAVGVNYMTDTDPTNITLQGPYVNGVNSGLRAKAWITLAPDWEGMTSGTTYRLSLASDPSKVLATGPWARLLPEQILAAAGYALASTTSRTVTLTYTAINDTQVVAQTTFLLTFGPADALSEQVHAPNVPATVTGATIPVSYDLSGALGLSNPKLIVSDPGRFTPQWCVCAFHARYSVPLTATRGTVQVPVSALEGSGIYGISIELGPSPYGYPYYSDFAFTRVGSANTSRPAAPVFSSNGSTPAHYLEIGYGASFQMSWDATSVPTANGAMLEISSAGPNTHNNYNTFNNPNGSGRDQNGSDSGSVYFAPLPATKGNTTVNGTALGLTPTLNNMVRVVATHNGSPVGEAGDVSMLSMDGIAASDGGFASSGYALNPNGNDAYLTSNQTTASGQRLSSLETFDQTTNHVTGTVLSSTSGTYFTPAWGVFGGDTGLFGTNDSSSDSTNYNLLSPVASGTVGSAWTSPDGNLLQLAQNPGGTTTAGLAGPNGPGGSYHVFGTDLATNTSGPEYDVSDPISSFGIGFYNWISVHPPTNTALITGSDLANSCRTPVIDSIDLANGQQTATDGLGSGITTGLGVDTTTNKAFVLTDCDNGLETYDLASKTGTLTTIPGFGNIYVAVDQQHGLVLITQLQGEDAAVNNNALSSVLVLKEDGTLVKRIETFNLFNGWLPFDSNSLQVNPGARTGVIWGYLTQQLQPFSY